LAGFDAVTLLHGWAVLLVHVEEVDFLVALSDVTLLVDPKQSVLQLLGVGIVAGLVNADGNGKRVFLG
jgi:hypothetical protein